MSVWSTKPVRDFLYLGDAAEAIIKLINTDYTGPVNLATGTSVSVGRIVEILESLSGKKVKNLNKEVSGPMNFECDISLLKKLTGWTPKHTLEEGLKITYERMKGWVGN